MKEAAVHELQHHCATQSLNDVSNISNDNSTSHIDVSMIAATAAAGIRCRDDGHHDNDVVYYVLLLLSDTRTWACPPVINH